MGYNSKNYFPSDHPQGQDYEKLLLLNKDCVKWNVKIEVETSFLHVLMVLNSKASSSQQNLQMTLKEVWIVSYLVFITDVQMCGSVFVCKYELRNCGSRTIWLLHFHFAFLMTMDIENPLRPIFVIVIVWSSNAFKP